MPANSTPPPFSDDVSDEPAIQIAGLTHWFDLDRDVDSRPALDKIDLTLQKGEVVVMGGPSGSGKTTLLTLIGGLRRVQEGSLRAAGLELATATETQLIALRRRIGFIFQAHNLFESLTAYQNVKMATDLEYLPPHKARPRVEEILRRLIVRRPGDEQKMHSFPSQLSGGQKQRVAVARALVNRPQLVLADEPTAALDRASGAVVVEMLQQLAKTRGTTVLLVTHDARILDIADRIVTMVDGRIRSDVSVVMAQEVSSFLPHSEIFRSLPPHVIGQIAERVKRVTIPAGQIVFRQGDEGDQFYLIHSGQANVMIRAEGASSEEVGECVASLGRGDVFGERSLFTGDPRNATILNPGPEPLVCYQLGKAGFQQVMQEVGSFDQQIRRLLFTRG